MPERLTKRGGVWYYVRRVPPEFVEFDPREIVRLSTKVREAEAPDELTDELMGHDTKKPKYGDGHGLHLKLKYIERIALAPGMSIATPLQLVKAAG